MKPEVYILFLFTLHIMQPAAYAFSISSILKNMFIPSHAPGSNFNSSDPSINIVILKRDVTGTIKKRSITATDPTKTISSNKASNTCSEDQLMVYLAEIQAINPESIINLSTYDELTVICRQVSDSLDKMDDFLKTCHIANDKSLYIQLIKGVDKLFTVLCDEKGSIRKQFEKYFSCLKQLHDDFETCFGPPDWTENLSKSEICKSYKDIADCYYIKAAKICGKPAAKVMKSLVKAVIDAIIPVHCPSVLMNPRIERELQADQSSETTHAVAPMVVLLNILLLFT